MVKVALGTSWSQETLNASRAAVLARLSDTEALGVDDVRELAAVNRGRLAADELVREAQLQALVKVQHAMERLRTCSTPEALLNAASRELRVTCGFSRVMLSEVHNSVWSPAILEAAASVAPEEVAFREWVGSSAISLDHGLLETDLVRRRIPALVTDAAHDPRTAKELVAAARWTSYVAAPITPARRVIGFFHADRSGQGRACDEVDCEALWSFSEHFGLLYERSILVKALQYQRSQVQQTLRRAAEQIDETCGAQTELVRRGSDAASPVRCDRPREGLSRVDRLLTRREREVLELLTTGATNSMLADQLVISEATVKSHLKRIYRKLHVASRAEAVATYLRIRQRYEGAR